MTGTRTSRSTGPRACKYHAAGRETDGASWGLAQAREHNLVNEIADTSGDSDAITETAGPSWIDPVHDATGNMTLAPKPGDEATAASGLLLVYDAWNRLAEVYEDDGGTTGELDGTDTQILACEYDGLNRRIVRDGAETWDFYYNTSWQVVERQCGQRWMEYVWDLRYIDAPVCRWYIGNFQSGGFSHLHYYTNDANMNVTALVNADDGDVDERYSYDPYGKVAVRDGDWSLDDNNASDWANEILYCGYRQDPDTGADGQGIYHVRNRHYHPTLGWITRDPLGYPDGPNRYAYARCRPLVFVDPDGRLVIYAEGAVDKFPGLADKSKAMSDRLHEWAKEHDHPYEPYRHRSDPDRFGSGGFADQTLIDTNAQDMLEDIKAACKRGEPIYIYAHSTGAATVARVLQKLEDYNDDCDEGCRVDSITFGSASTWRNEVE